MQDPDEYTQMILDQLSGWGGVSVRKMFGGVGLYRDTIMFGLIYDKILYFRTDSENLEEYKNAGSEPFQPPGRKMIMPYWEVPIDILEDHTEVCEWANQAFKAAKRMKLKEKKKEIKYGN